tara:strand:- start:260 stop:934 length:675 start_codon:yes stop_codon:yes gene_type:complete
MTTIGETISRVRNVLKAVKEDPFMTDRFIYSVIIKYAKVLIRRQDNEDKIFQFTSLFKDLTFVELIDVDKVTASCSGIKSNCIIKRTKDKLPEMIEGASGPLIRLVESIDGSKRLGFTFSNLYVHIANSTNFKYNNSLYYWYKDGHIYIPNVDWDAIRVQALFDDDISFYNCPEDGSPCELAQTRETPIPDYLFAEIEQMTLKELLTAGQIPSDGADDSQNVMR